jgi:hypothetical protein
MLPTLKDRATVPASCIVVVLHTRFHSKETGEKLGGCVRSWSALL